MSGKPIVVFVLGGPGAGKGTQCKKITDEYGFVHLSAGDLLRAERKRDNSEVGAMIDNFIKEGKIVPVEVTVGLIKSAMQEGLTNGSNKYLIDGFPRNKDNLEGWHKIMGEFADVRFTLFLDCPEKTMETRLLGRNEGRTDDNIESIRKRFHTYQVETRPILDIFEKEGKLRKIDSNRPIDEIFGEVERLFLEFKEAAVEVSEDMDPKKVFAAAMRSHLQSQMNDPEKAGDDAAKPKQFCDLTSVEQVIASTAVIQASFFNPAKATWQASPVSRFNLSGGVVVKATETSGLKHEHSVYINGYGVLESWESPLLPKPKEGLIAPQPDDGACIVC